jgi:hypothetical protein
VQAEAVFDGLHKVLRSRRMSFPCAMPEGKNRIDHIIAAITSFFNVIKKDIIGTVVYSANKYGRLLYG